MLNNKEKIRFTGLIFVFFAFFFVISAVCAQTIDLSQFVGPLPVPVPAVNASPSVEPVVDSMAEVLPRAESLKDEASGLEQLVKSLTDIQQISGEYTQEKARLDENKRQFSEIKESGSYGFEKVSALRSDIRKIIEAVALHAKSVSERLTKIESLKQTWVNKESNWQNQQSALAADINPAIRNIYKESLTLIAKARKSFEGIESPLVAFQQRVIDLQREAQAQLAEIDRLLAGMRKDLFRKSRPAMFTPTFISQFNRPAWEELWLGIASVELPGRSFYNASGWILVLQLLLITGFAWFFRSLRLKHLEQLKLSFIFDRYISAAILIGVILPLPFFETIPTFYWLVFSCILSFAGSRLVAAVISQSWRRKLLYFIVALYLLIRFLLLINFPAPLMRLFTALVGFSGALLCFWRARVNVRENGSPLYIMGLKTGAMTLSLVFFTQVAGYMAFSNHLLDVTIKTIFLGVIAWMIDIVMGGIVETVFDNSLVHKNELVKKYHKIFIKRTDLIIDVIVLFTAFSAMLSVWGFFDSPWLAAEKILAFGVSLQGYRLSLGMLVWAVVLVYASLAISWLIQRVLDEEVYPRRKVEKGVGISINRLIHYAFVVIGVVTGLSSIGIGLQNLTVIVGALGIGIGFGLQNIVNNFASGLILLFERSIKVGDIVQIRGDWGTIKNLGLRATVVETFDRSEMIVPNSDLVSTTVTNWTLSDRQTRLIVQVGVAYGSDVQKVTQILLRIAQDNPFVMKFPAPAVFFMNFGASSLDFELRAWVADIDIRMKIKNEIHYEIDRLFRENDIEIPFSQHDLHIRTIAEPARAALTGMAMKADNSEPSR